LSFLLWGLEIIHTKREARLSCVLIANLFNAVSYLSSFFTTKACEDFREYTLKLRLGHRIILEGHAFWKHFVKEDTSS